MAVNVVQVGSQAVNLGAGNAGAGTLRVCVCTDDPNLSALSTKLDDLETKLDSILTAIDSSNSHLSNVSSILTDIHISASNRIRVLSQVL